MRNILRSLTLFVIVVSVSCVTINIYFPAEELRGAADRIVDEVYGEKPEPVEKAPETPGSSFLPRFGVSSAYAAQDINVSTPEIRALRADVKVGFDQLSPSSRLRTRWYRRQGLSGPTHHRRARAQATRRNQAPDRCREPGSQTTLPGDCQKQRISLKGQ